MHDDYLIGYLSKDYVRDFFTWYTAIFILNLPSAFGTDTGFSLLGLFFTHEPLVYMGFYFGTVIAWNYAKEESIRRFNERKGLIYCKSVAFLYLTIVAINLISTLYAGRDIGLGLLIVNNDYKFYTLSIIYMLVESYESWKYDRNDECEGTLPKQLR